MYRYKVQTQTPMSNAYQDGRLVSAGYALDELLTALAEKHTTDAE